MTIDVSGLTERERSAVALGALIYNINEIRLNPTLYFQPQDEVARIAVIKIAGVFTEVLINTIEAAGIDFRKCISKMKRIEAQMGMSCTQSGHKLAQEAFLQTPSGKAVAV